MSSVLDVAVAIVRSPVPEFVTVKVRFTADPAVCVPCPSVPPSAIAPCPRPVSATEISGEAGPPLVLLSVRDVEPPPGKTRLKLKGPVLSVPLTDIVQPVFTSHSGDRKVPEPLPLAAPLTVAVAPL